MARHCTVCDHPERDAVDHALVSGTSYRDVAARFDLTTSAIGRHRGAHLSPAIARIHGAVIDDQERSGRLAERVEELLDRAQRILDTAEQGGRVQQALAAIRELRGLLELLGKATGELKPDGPQTTVNVLASPDLHALLAAIGEALRPYPDAWEAVTARLSGIAGTEVVRPALALASPAAAEARS